MIIRLSSNPSSEIYDSETDSLVSESGSLEETALKTDEFVELTAELSSETADSISLL
ncbi:MAG TPA: hypothetical protein PK629_04710 [Oscillospiraceae bacterium]|nr:hypothetical protein [Oscillospiraceae bacterium]HPF55839.1 hypothetical protein [Clostridiales bacterium]HPK34847.1 hypothetical protein [Oscillospiraceae bacterium]